MSTFTEFNGPGAGMSAASTAQLLKLIEAFNSISSTLNAHLSKTASSDDIHGAKTYTNEQVAEAKNTLQSAINNKLDKSVINDYIKTDTANNKFAVATDLSNLQSTVSGMYTNEQINTLIDKKVSKDIYNSLKESFEALQTAYNKFTDNFNITDDTGTYKGIFTATEHLLGRLHADTVIDFTRWKLVHAQYAGTGASTDTSTNGIYLLGVLSTNWDNQPTPKPDNHEPKAATVYIKYTNSNPFDAILHCTATLCGNNEWKGRIDALVNREVNKWSNLTFHLLHGTDVSGNSRVYVGISADGLNDSAVATDVDANASAALHFYVSGINFLPLDDSTGLASRVQTIVKRIALYNISRIEIGEEDTTSITFAIRPQMVYIDSSTGNKNTAEFITNHDLEISNVPIGGIINWHDYMRIVKRLDDDKKFTIEEYALTTSGAYNPICTLRKEDIHIYRLIDNDTGTIAELTADDFDWDDYQVITEFAANVPIGWLPCNGDTVKIEDYPLLAEAFGITDALLTEFTLPIQDFSIIHAQQWDTVDGANPDISDLLSLDTLNQRIAAEEITRAAEDTRLQKAIEDEGDTRHDTDLALSTRITEENERATYTENLIASNLVIETDRATDRENVLSTLIDAERTRATGAENLIASNLVIETDRATDRENVLSTLIGTSTTALSTFIGSEIIRATGAESALSTIIGADSGWSGTLVNAIRTAESERAVLSTLIDAEVDRATDRENVLSTLIDAEVDRATGVESDLRQLISNTRTYSDTADLPGTTPAADGTVTTNGQQVLVIDGTTIKVYKATVVASTVTWAEVV